MGLSHLHTWSTPHQEVQQMEKKKYWDAEGDSNTDMKIWVSTMSVVGSATHHSQVQNCNWNYERFSKGLNTNERSSHGDSNLAKADKAPQSFKGLTVRQRIQQEMHLNWASPNLFMSRDQTKGVILKSKRKAP